MSMIIQVRPKNMWFVCLSVGLIILTATYRDSLFRNMVHLYRRKKKAKIGPENELRISLDKLVLVDSIEKCITAVKALNSVPTDGILGLAVQFNRDRYVSVLQIATQSGVCLVVQVPKVKPLPVELRKLLASTRVLKVGVDMEDMKRRVTSLYFTTVSSTVDLRVLADRYSLPNFNSLEELCTHYLGIELNEESDVKTSNWQRDTLSDEQISYASSRALATVQIYHKMLAEAKKKRTWWQVLTAPLVYLKSKYCEGYFDLPDNVIDVMYRNAEQREDPNSLNHFSSSLNKSKDPNSSFHFSTSLNKSKDLNSSNHFSNSSNKSKDQNSLGYFSTSLNESKDQNSSDHFSDNLIESKDQHSLDHISNNLSQSEDKNSTENFSNSLNKSKEPNSLNQSSTNMNNNNGGGQNDSIVVRKLNDSIRNDLGSSTVDDCSNKTSEVNNPDIDSEQKTESLAKGTVPIRNRPLYHNCYLQAPDGDILCTCDKKKAEWYIAKELGVVVQEDPLTVRLKFEPSGRALGEVGKYYTQVKVNRCVVCGASEKFVRKNVVPREYRKYFPLVMKSHQSHDVLLLCPKCHEESGKYDLAFRKQLIKKCDVTPKLPHMSDENVQQLRLALTHLKEGKEVDDEKKAKLVDLVRSVTGLETVTDNLIDMLQEHIADRKEKLNVISQIPHIPKNFFNKTSSPRKDSGLAHGIQVVQYYETMGGGLVELEKAWREHFLRTMNPRYLPELWSISHNQERLHLRKDQNRIEAADAKLAGVS